MSSWSGAIGDADHNQERLFFQDNFEGLSEAIPILFIEDTHKIKEQRFLFLLLFLTFLFRFSCFFLFSTLFLLFFQSFLKFFLFGQIFFQLF